MEAGSGRDAGRLVAFTDAVVAIAITLLALPLIEIGREIEGQDALEALLAERAFDYLGFVIGFFVIARLWWGHHRVFAHVVRWSGPLVLLNVLWLFTIVLLPVATAMATSFRPDDTPGAVAIYLGLMAVSSGFLTAMSIVVLRRPALTDGRDDAAADRVAGSIATTTGFVLALVVGTAFPVVNYFALFVLALAGRLNRPIRALLRRGTSSRRAEPR